MIGILGAGQLGRMMALAGLSLGFRFRLLDGSKGLVASRLNATLVGDFEDPVILQEFATDLGVITYEFENIPLSTVVFLNKLAPVFPPIMALNASQDRLIEKEFLTSLGIPTARFYKIDTLADLQHAVDETGYPCVLKTRRFGYDGKGQFVLKTNSDLTQAWDAVHGTALILEQFIPFEYEVSMVAVRSTSFGLRYYQLTENLHYAGILRKSTPLRGLDGDVIQVELQATAQDYIQRVMEHLDYVGVLALEFFVSNGKLVANEMAPRVHNSGHWTIEGAQTSQFENHLRAIAGLPLGETALVGWCSMINIIGALPDMASVLETPYSHLHLYDKEPRPGRKIGHITVCAPSLELLESAITRIEKLMGMNNQVAINGD